MKTTRIRVLQLINNFYRDEDIRDNSEKIKPLGPYCVLGYFDAFDSILVEKKSIWSEISKWTLDNLDGNTHYRMIACMTDDNVGDEAFWSDEKTPFYFITLIRKIEPNKMTKEVMDVCKTKLDSISQFAYYSFEHSEIIVVTKANKYTDGIRAVENLREKLSALKLFTLFAVKQQFLQNLINIDEAGELVDCRLKCIIKDFTMAEIFLEKLREICTSKSNARFRWYYTLGGHDWLIEIDGIEINYILSLYKEMDIMTHSNDSYANAFYNIETEIFGHKVEKIDE